MIGIYYSWSIRYTDLVTKEGVLKGSKGTTLIVDNIFVNIPYENSKQYINKKVRVTGYIHEPKPCPPNLQCQIFSTMNVKSIELTD